ncbi:MAG TPA: TetR/AcrR family transcriptional regulator [Longimicrobiaceae bacterium]|jgi:AcrR family transcriptional regulator|nr:TetR/AcrR family transcriptional regulator [Longimicrobiaceae bacterium]
MGKGEQTREHILERAAVLFNRQGFAGASMADVMEATGLRKGGIYRHFESKERLALEAFDHAVGLVRARFVAALDGKRNAVDRLRAIVGVFREYVIDPPIPGGCPVMNTAIENDDGNPELRARALAVMEEWRAMVCRTVEKGVERGELRSTTDAEETASVVISLLEGAIMMSKLYHDPVHLQRAVEHLDRHLEAAARA